MGSSQKFIARNRAPRVQIEYDVELYGAEKKVQLPFVMGVMADLAGKPEEPRAAAEPLAAPAASDSGFVQDSGSGGPASGHHGMADDAGTTTTG